VEVVGVLKEGKVELPASVHLAKGAEVRVIFAPRGARTLMSNAAKVIALPDDLQAFAEERVRASEYASVGEVAEEAFRLLQRRDERRHEVREELAAVFREIEDGTCAVPARPTTTAILNSRTRRK